MTLVEAPQTRLCAMCAQPFVPTRTKLRFCSPKCGRLYWDSVDPDDEPRGDVPKRSPYREVCLMCSRDRPLVLTEAEAKAMQPFRCALCGGLRVIEPDMLTNKDMPRPKERR